MILDDYLKTCTTIYHTTLNPKGPGVVRVHLIPPKKLKAGMPWVAILNGYYILPFQTSWAILLKCFIERVNSSNQNPYENMDELIENTIESAHKVFNKTEKSVLKKDLKDIISVLTDIAKGKTVNEKIGFTTIAKYSKFMSAPHRMDLMISSMNKNNEWSCNQKCMHCYAAGEKMSNVKELSTEEWIKIIDKCRDSNIPQLTFTGGEPTLRDDLVELIHHSRWFVTRLNTNGILLSKDLCKKLYNADLDSVQITLYSSDEKTHNLLVGGDHFKDTIEGIKNAIEAKLDVSVNTPLCSLNKDYVKTIDYLNNLGVKYFTCSGIIESGNAIDSDSSSSRLTKEELSLIVKKAYNYTKENGCEISFTSPGLLDEDLLNKMNMTVPSCGACMSNMAIAPNGDVIPCQSWLFEDSLGNMLKDEWKKIWNSKKCKKQRRFSVKHGNACPLKGVRLS